MSRKQSKGTAEAMGDEPMWEIGKHDWRDDDRCMICGLLRTRHPDDPDGPFGYDVDGDGCGFQDAPLPCCPRLAQKVTGYYTAKEASAMLKITSTQFVRRTRMRNLRPSAVLTKANVYLWRADQLDIIALGEKEWKQWRALGRTVCSAVRQALVESESFQAAQAELRCLVEDRGPGVACAALGLPKWFAAFL